MKVLPSNFVPSDTGCVQVPAYICIYLSMAIHLLIYLWLSLAIYLSMAIYLSIDRSICLIFYIYARYSFRYCRFQKQQWLSLKAKAVGDSFKYLGRFFDCEMTNKTCKSKVILIFSDLLQKIDYLPLHPKINLIFIVGMFYQRQCRISPLLIDQKHESLKILMAYSHNISANGLISLSTLL